MHLLETVFGRTHDVALGQECARAALIFIYGLVLVRVSGRRSFGKWSALDIIVSIVLGSSLSRALTGGAPLFGTMAACAVLLALHKLLAKAAAHSPTWSRLLEGRAITIARDGEVLHEPRLGQSISQQDLAEALRQASIDDIADVRVMMLEPSGKLTVRKRQ